MIQYAWDMMQSFCECKGTPNATYVFSFKRVSNAAKGLF